ncbi:hypothetical protein L2E82_35942 [Cichorium intybus]|uniref:Uncharacterized protein n=1 Tax=Cichorium intybus TaxID=13427 RepID=A0ACB9BQ62_CICIN|nr:hypothetical protein L2E82_35942 [Cichorium intybus]
MTTIFTALLVYLLISQSHNPSGLHPHFLCFTVISDSPRRPRQTSFYRRSSSLFSDSFGNDCRSAVLRNNHNSPVGHLSEHIENDCKRLKKKVIRNKRNLVKQN